MNPNNDPPHDDRAVSEVIAVALLVGIVLMAVMTVLLIGGPQLLATQEEAEIRQAERALTQLDSEATRIMDGSGGPQELDLGLRGNSGTLDVDPDAGNITMEYISSFQYGDDVTVLETSLGTIEYENSDTTVAYQGGGVWRSDADGSTMVSPPEITLDEMTLDVAVSSTERSGSIHSDVRLSHADLPEQHYPDTSAGLENRVGGSMIIIYVESQYYEAWGQYFEDETGAIVQYDPDHETVAVILTGLPLDYSPDAGVVATSTAGEIQVEGTGAYVDSYNSNIGSYADTQGNEGIVRSAGGVRMGGDALIDGDVDADRDINFQSGSSQIDGNASAGDQVKKHSDDSVTGDVVENTHGVSSIPPMDALITREVHSLKTDNDNAETDAIDGTTLDLSTTDRLPAGEYYLDEIELDGETLILDTSEDNITIGVEDWIGLRDQGGGDPGAIEIEGNNSVQVYVNASDSTTATVTGLGQRDLHFYVEDGASIETVTDDRERGTQFQVLGPSWLDGAVAGSRGSNVSVTGMIIAPAGPLGDGEFHVMHGELFGSVVSGNITLGQYGEIHFDRAALDMTIPVGEQIPRVEYLYVRHHELSVKEAS